MQVSKNFDLREFIDPITFAEKGESSIDLIDKRLIDIAQFIRDSTGEQVVINSWHMGGPLKECGFRRPESKTGAKHSQHKLGKAIDVHIGHWTGEQMNTWASENRTKLYQLGVRQIEDKSLTTTWLHLSTKDTGFNGIQIIDLVKVTEAWKV